MENGTFEVKIILPEDGVVEPKETDTELVWVDDAELGRYQISKGIGKVLVCTGFTDDGKATFTNTDV